MAIPFDAAFFAEIDRRAENSKRRRANTNLHRDASSLVQRLFISMMPDSYVRPHKHTQAHKWECFLVVSGQLDFLLFDDNGVLTDRVTLSAEGECRGIEIPPGQWHATVCREPVVFFEVKQGPYEVESDKVFADWAPEEADVNVPVFLEALKNLKLGFRVS